MTRLVISLLCLLGAVVARAEAPPATLSRTGLYADIATKQLAPGVRLFSPQYPLWTDGATKKRWFRLPAGEIIDTRDLDRWIFPVGTKLWKEFSFSRRVETRYLEKLADGSWVYASYEWNTAETEATRVSDAGKKNVHPTGPGTSHDIPSLSQCKFCHSRGGDPVEGLDALQLSDDRDPLAPHGEPLPAGAVTFRSLAEEGLLSSVPSAFVAAPPRIRARSPEGRAAMGYLHGNCGGCHNPSGRAGFTGQFLRHELAAVVESDEQSYATTVDKESNYQIPGLSTSYRIRSGDPAASAVHYRMSLSGRGQMPPVGRETVDAAAAELLARWIRSLTQGD